MPVAFVTCGTSKGEENHSCSVVSQPFEDYKNPSKVKKKLLTKQQVQDGSLALWRAARKELPEGSEEPGLRRKATNKIIAYLYISTDEENEPRASIMSSS